MAEFSGKKPAAAISETDHSAQVRLRALRVLRG
jgi:hypothetical protein